MRVNREWTEEQEVFELIVDALDGAGLEPGVVVVKNEVGEYGDRGAIEINTGNRRFRIVLTEIVE